jgi:hypothetical protein
MEAAWTEVAGSYPRRQAREEAAEEGEAEVPSAGSCSPPRSTLPPRGNNDNRVACSLQEHLGGGGLQGGGAHRRVGVASEEKPSTADVKRPGDNLGPNLVV